ncbi:MAG: nucleotidyltransferase domain-containing protein [Candidatus Shapirobacteria bacterium]
MKKMQTNLPILAVYLFGSSARKQQRQDSDLDVAVIILDKNNAPLRKIINFLASYFPVEKLDPVIVDLQNTSPLLLFQIIKEGKLLYEKKKNSHQSLESRIMRLYFDDEYRQKIFEEYLNKSFEQNTYGHR